MLLKVLGFPVPVWQQLIEAFYLCESIVKQGMLHSRGELLLMLDADGATKVTDLEKLENQVCKRLITQFEDVVWYWLSNVFVLQIHAVAKTDYHGGDSAASDTTFRISDIPIVAFGSRAHLEEKALATVKSTNDACCVSRILIVAHFF